MKNSTLSPANAARVDLADALRKAEHAGSMFAQAISDAISTLPNDREPGTLALQVILRDLHNRASVIRNQLEDLR